MKIGSRTIKTAIGTPISISLAQLFGLSNFISAGILTILCIQSSRKRSVMTAWQRFLACVVAAVLSVLFFELFGYNPIAVGAMLVCFIPVLVWLKVTPGIGTSSVIILNLYGAQHLSVTFLVDQFFVIIVGIGVALLVNLYMPSMDKQLKKKQDELEHYFQTILNEIALYIRNKNENWDGKELQQSEDLLEDAMELVLFDKENHLLRAHHPYYDYFKMRQKQLELLQRMLPLVSRLPDQYTISFKVSGFFEQLAEAVHPGNTAVVYLNELEGLRQIFDQQPLPTTQKEFETRANLYQLLHEIEDYLLVKKRFKESDVNEAQGHKKRPG
ncbi:aromatic acid exporter family protein [Barrientosiimonas marina]|uniref:Aromatic acid exporter family protein n=1 Tax=Lentibacillus kimchii TaxID=1542911 RepID=A0ABW2UW64_9BACI